MNFEEAKAKLAENGIYQLNKGETLQDALDFVDGKIRRVGYKIKTDNGRKLDKNEIIAESNKEAFGKFTRAEYNFEGPFETREETIENAEDKREDITKSGFLTNCFYCGCLLYINYDKPGLEEDDFPGEEAEIHCDGCERDAILNLAM